MLHLIKAQQFYTDLALYPQYKVLQKIVEFEDFSRLLSDFPVLYKADSIFKDFSRKPSKFKYFSCMCEPCTVIQSTSLPKVWHFILSLFHSQHSDKTDQPLLNVVAWNEPFWFDVLSPSQQLWP